MENENNGDSNCNWCAWNNSQRLGKGTGGVRLLRLVVLFCFTVYQPVSGHLTPNVKQFSLV